MSFGLMSTTAAELMAVGEQVAMAQHDALRRAFRAGGEQHDRRVVARAPGRWRGPCAASDRTSAREPRGDADLRRADPRGRRPSPATASAATSASSLAFSTNRRAVTTSAISAARHAALRGRRAGREVEHRRHAARRPAARRSVTSAARDVGSSTPTRSPGRVRWRQDAAERVAGGDQRRGSSSAADSMSSATTWPPPCCAVPRAARRRASCRCGAVANIDCTISSPSARRSAARRARPVTPSGDASRRGGENADADRAGTGGAAPCRPGARTA